MAVRQVKILYAKLGLLAKFLGVKFTVTSTPRDPEQ